MMRFGVVILAFVAMWPAWARDASGQLSGIITPNEGRSAIVVPGGTFTVTATEQGAIEIVGDATYAIDAAWVDVGGYVSAECTVPENAAPGVYAIRLQGSSTNGNAVHVVREVKETYIAVHITDLHLGSVSNGRPVQEIADELVAAIKVAPADLLILTGEITAEGKRDQYADAIAFLDAIGLPAIVCPGEGDGPDFEKYFGPVPFSVPVGADNFLAVDSRTTPVGEGYQAGVVARLRDGIKPGRWSIGLTHYYGPRWDARMSIAVLVDDPLDHLFTGYYHRENRVNEKRVIWGTTQMTMTPAASDGAVRFVEIGPRGIRPEAPRFLVKTE